MSRKLEAVQEELHAAESRLKRKQEEWEEERDAREERILGLKDDLVRRRPPPSSPPPLPLSTQTEVSGTLPSLSCLPLFAPGISLFATSHVPILCRKRRKVWWRTLNKRCFPEYTRARPRARSPLLPAPS